MDGDLERVKNGIAYIEFGEISSYVKAALDKGCTPMSIVEAMSAGMKEVGEKFEKGEYFLSELVMAGEMMKEAMKILEPLLAGVEMKNIGTVVIATVKDDIHDIGKNLVSTMLASAGFRVIDLGVDVPEMKVVEAVRETNADIVALSSLLTITVDRIKSVNDALERNGLRRKVKVIAGGACVTEEIARKLGCDAFGRDAVEAVDVCKRLMKEK